MLSAVLRTPRRVDVLIPEQQGLKRFHVAVDGGGERVDVLIPEQQGLKRAGWAWLLAARLRVDVLIPEQQGLKRPALLVHVHTLLLLMCSFQNNKD